MMNKSTHLKIKGMHCTGCEETIENAIGRLPGVQKVKADYVKQTVDVEFNGKLIGEAGIRLAVEGKGYQFESEATSPQSNLQSGFIFLLFLLIVGGITFWGKSMIPGLVGEMSLHLTQAMLFSIGFFPVFIVLACAADSSSATRLRMGRNLRPPPRRTI